MRADVVPDMTTVMTETIDSANEGAVELRLTDAFDTTTYHGMYIP
jgi:hypothetical protein